MRDDDEEQLLSKRSQKSQIKGGSKESDESFSPSWQVSPYRLHKELKRQKTLEREEKQKSMDKARLAESL